MPYQNVVKTVQRPLASRLPISPYNLTAIAAWGGVAGVGALYVVQPWDYIGKLMNPPEPEKPGGDEPEKPEAKSEKPEAKPEKSEDKPEKSGDE